MKTQYVKNWDQFINTLNEEELSAEQKAYQKFFKEKLADYDVNSPDELDDSEKKKFFSEIKKEWPDEPGNEANESLDEDFSYITRGYNDVAIKLAKFIMKNNGPVGWSQMSDLLKEMAAKLEEGKDINALTYFTK